MSRAGRVPVSRHDRSAAGEAADAGYATAFGMEVGVSRSAERWARITFEQGPRSVQAFVRFGWRWVLGLRLLSRGEPDQVAGLGLATCRADLVVLRSGARWLTCAKVVRVDDDRLTVSTFVRFDRRPGRLLWTLLSPVHHVVEPWLITSAVRRTESAQQ